MPPSSRSLFVRKKGGKAVAATVDGGAKLPASSHPRAAGGPPAAGSRVPGVEKACFCKREEISCPPSCLSFQLLQVNAFGIPRSSWGGSASSSVGRRTTVNWAVGYRLLPHKRKRRKKFVQPFNGPGPLGSWRSGTRAIPAVYVESGGPHSDPTKSGLLVGPRREAHSCRPPPPPQWGVDATPESGATLRPPTN